MTSTKARSAGLGAVATFAGFAASLGAGTAHAADAPSTTHHTPTPNRVCTIDRGDVEYRAVDTAKPQQWRSATDYAGYQAEPAGGFEIRLKDSAKDCGGSVDISLASYTTHGPTWEKSGGEQAFIGSTTTTLAKDHATATLTVKLPGTATADCFGQLDLYFGSTIFDGGTGRGHGPLPDYDKHVLSPNPKDLIAGWNGGTKDCGTTAPPTAPPSTPSSPPSSSTPSTPPSTPVKPASSAPTTPAPSTPGTTTPPSTPSSPGTPTLAHTGSHAGAISLVALAFFGAGGAVMTASRKAAARKH